MSNPELDRSKVEIHIQVSENDVSSNNIVDQAKNNQVTIGSNNIDVVNESLAHPVTSFNTVVKVSPPDVDDGVFRNLRGLDTESNYIDQDDQQFVIGGFYSEKHRREMLAHLNSLNQGVSGRTFFLNDPAPQTGMLFTIDEMNTRALLTLDYTSLSQLFAGEQLITIDEIVASSVIELVDMSTDTHTDLVGSHVELQETRAMIKLDPTNDVVTDYDVWSNSNNLSAGEHYMVGGQDYVDDVLPLIEDYLDNL